MKVDAEAKVRDLGELCVVSHETAVNATGPCTGCIAAALAAAHAEGREEACRLVCTYCDLATQDLSGDHVTCGAAKILGPNAPWYHKWADLSPDAGVPVAWRKCEASRIRSAQ